MTTEVSKFESIRFAVRRSRTTPGFCRRQPDDGVVSQLRSAQVVAVVLLLAWLPGLVPHACAGERPIKLLISTTSLWDDNVFRVNDSAGDPQAVRGLTGRSDRISTTSVGLSFNKAYAQQVVTFTANQTATRYDKFAFLDRNGFSYNGAWQWHLTPRISGTLSADRSESLVGFADTQVLSRNVLVTSNQGLSLDGWLFGGWHLLGGVSTTTQKTSALFAAQPDFTQDTWEGGIKYVSAAQNSVSYVERQRRGINTGQSVDFVNFLDSGFSVHEKALSGAWALSGKSQLTGGLTQTTRRNNNISQRDFSAMSGNLGYQWTPTGKLSLNFSAARAVAPFANGTASTFRVDDSLTFSPVWRPTGKTTLGLTAMRRASDFLGPVGPVAGPPRRDTLNSLQLKGTWTPHTSVTLSASIQREQRRSTDGAFNYEQVGASLTAAVTF